MHTQFQSDSRIHPSLGLFDCICMVVGIIVGVGIYETLPTIVAQGPSLTFLIVIWLVGGLISLMGALCYAELACTYPVQGGDFFYLSRAFGPKIGYMFAWSELVIIRPGSIAALAFPFAHYLQTFYSPFHGSFLSAYEDLILATLAIVVLTIINCFSAKSGTRCQNILTVVKVLGLVLISILAFTAPVRTDIMMSEVTTEGSIFLALVLVLYTFGGWNEISFITSEVKRPEKNIFRSLILALMIVSVVYIVATIGFINVLGIRGAIDTTSIAYDAVSKLSFNINAVWVSLLIVVSTLGSLNGMIFTGPRVSYALGTKQVLFSSLSHLSSKAAIPSKALALQAVISITIVWLARSFSITVVYTSIIVWLFFSATAASVIVLRVKDKNLNRPYKIHGYPITVLLFGLVSLLMSYNAFLYNIKGSIIAVVVMLAGLSLYRNPEP